MVLKLLLLKKLILQRKHAKGMLDFFIRKREGNFRII